MTYHSTPLFLLRSTLLAAVTLGAAACGDDGTAATDGSTGQDASSSGTTGTSEGPPTTSAPTEASTSADATTLDATSTDATTLDATSTDATTLATTEATTEASTDATTDTSTDTSTGDPAVWQPPSCDSVTGTGAVSFSHDEGATLAPMDQTITPVHYTFGLVALGKPGAMLAGSGEQILASSDAGCSWHVVGPAGGGNSPALVLRAAGETRAYAFGDNDSVIMRVDDEVITKLTSPAGQEGIVGLGVDPGDPDHLRIGDTAGRLWDSKDAGQTWDPAGKAAFAGTLAYRAAFDPQDLDHALFGALTEGVLVTHDGGASWTPATGLGVGDFNGFSVAVSPAAGEVVWVEGYDLADPDEGKARHVYRSEDGGLSFTAVIDSDEATLYNGNRLFPHPSDPDVMYFVYGSNFANYGTDVYRYDHAADAITLTHNKWHDAIVEFLPGDPSWIYLGLSIEPGGG